MAAIHPTDVYNEKHHRGSVLNDSHSVGADGTGRYPGFERTRGRCVNLGGTAVAIKALVPCIGKGWGSFFVFRMYWLAP